MLEPIGDTFDIDPGECAQIYAETLGLDGTIELETYINNCLSIVVFGDIVVRIGDKEINFPVI
jgi:hypothetical protein